jgi:hypothetical protein
MVHTAKFTVNASVFMERTDTCFLLSVVIAYPFPLAQRTKLVVSSPRLALIAAFPDPPCG